MNENELKTKEEVLEYAIELCEKNIGIIKFVKLDILYNLKYSYEMEQEDIDSIVKSINNIDKILRKYRDILLQTKEAK